MIHTPVLSQETLRFWQAQAGGTYIDGTVGTGGHCEKLLEKDPEARCLGMDVDPNALSIAKKRLERFRDRITLIQENYKNLSQRAQQIQWPPANGILLDLGVSSLQLDDSKRGFSFRAAGPLDMRMNPAQKETARDLIRRLSAQQLAQILKAYGEEKYARRIAEAIKKRELTRPIEDTATLAELISRLAPSYR
ncbi:MAG: 16S rRNA (cytosine(1402)-N(4))-methyltransferase RsmH, partial [Elusimicrobia bacterium]|nr:16S rRNA (cytosine(1402)-N(4))-methyltransferase RsmH [Elusimicrobiota bacterium]